ncbi:glycosyltransferase family A protein [Vibrio cholerae]|uniref:glycosyltransferase family A protein n=1 Tax=Vibrio cholerae TaxID=666 RepID=UPI0020D09E43|nr:glycosyltransferase family A protein [Vibrio cholerae]
MSYNKKVSVVTPCYNGEKFIYRLLDSILIQDYPHIEMYVIDDGSTDNSAQVIQSYIPKFIDKGYTLSYLYQDNSGQSEAINKGLKLITGDYFVWPDSDDFYIEKTAISQLVNVIENSDEQTSTVRCHCELLDEVNLNKVGEFATNQKNRYKEDLFEDCLFAQNGFWFVPGNYMAKVEVLRSLLPSLNIYTEKNAGQNWQLMLPLFYKKKCLTIPKNLYGVLVRSDSHSRGQYSTYEKTIEKYGAYERTIINTLDSMSLPEHELQSYKDTIQRKYKNVRLQVMIDFQKRHEAKLAFKHISENNKSLSTKLKIKYYLMNVPWLYRTLKFLTAYMKHRV